jgi:AraC-like DNA-binding protein
MRYLRDRRLDHARDRLTGGDRAPTVAEAALEAGFTHLGRFSQVYRERFGETPSNGLKRTARTRIN